MIFIRMSILTFRKCNLSEKSDKLRNKPPTSSLFKLAQWVTPFNLCLHLLFVPLTFLSPLTLVLSPHLQ